MKDEIIAELWQIKDELAREANYDVHVLCQKLREQETASCEQVVDRSTSSVGVGIQTEGTTLPGG
jgi:hypothetical protein